MTLLWLEGFESFGTTVGAAPSPTGVVARKYTVTSETLFDVENGRTGYALEPANGANFITPDLANTDPTMIVGFALRIDNADGGVTYTNLIHLSEDITASLVLSTYGGELIIKLGMFTVIGQTTGLGLTPRVWYYIELKATCNNTTGSYEVRVGGKNVLSATNVDTRNGLLGYYNRVTFNSSTIRPQYDDMYICDSTGSVNNGFLGDIIVKTIRPDGDSTANFITASPSANHYVNVQEAVADDNTSYNQDNTSGARELYDHSALAGLSSITGVMLNANLRTNTGVNENFKHLTKSSTTENTSANVTTNVTSFNTFTFVVEQNPDTSSAWTTVTVDAAKFGIELP